MGATRGEIEKGRTQMPQDLLPWYAGRLGQPGRLRGPLHPHHEPIRFRVVDALMAPEPRLGAQGKRHDRRRGTQPKVRARSSAW